VVTSKLKQKQGFRKPGKPGKTINFEKNQRNLGKPRENFFSLTAPGIQGISSITFLSCDPGKKVLKSRHLSGKNALKMSKNSGTYFARLCLNPEK